MFGADKLNRKTRRRKRREIDVSGSEKRVIQLEG